MSTFSANKVSPSHPNPPSHLDSFSVRLKERRDIMQVLPRKEDVANLLAEAHRKIDPSIVRIVHITCSDETDSNEPVKLLEVNPDTSPSGIIPIGFGADPPDVPYPSVVIEVTEEEYNQVKSGKLKLPENWNLGTTLYPSE
jgi:hypothetical protein